MKPFVPIYTGIMDYLLRGDISRSEFGLYVMMHVQADYSTGIWTGSAPRVDGTAPRGAELRATQREMKHLADIGLVKHFHHHGARGNFPWLINKYLCRTGALRGKQLNATLSTSLGHLVYEACAESDAESVAVSAPYQEVRVKREEKREHQPPRESKPKTFLPVAEGFEQFFAAYPRHVARAAAEKAWRQVVKPEEVAAILARIELNKLGIWKVKEKQFIPYPASWLRGRRWLDEIEEGGSNGKLVSFAEKRSQKNADAIQRVLGRAEEASGDIRRALPPAHN